MKNIAIGLAMIVFLSILIEPMVEFANVTREKITVGSALSNSFRSARDRSLVYESHRELEAIIDQDRFVDYFSEAFESAMNLTRAERNGNTIEYTSNNGKYNTFTVTMDFTEETDEVFEEQTVTIFKVKAESDYNFKTKYLRLAESAGENVGFQLKSEREYILSVKN